MLKINIKPGEKKIVYKTLSLSINYVLADSEIENSLKNISRKFDVRITELQKSNLLSDSITEIRIPNSDGTPDEIIVNKIKLDSSFNNNYFRNHLAGLIKKLVMEEVKHIHIFLPEYKYFKNYFDSESYFIQSFIEGLYYGSYSFDLYKTKKKVNKELNIVLHNENRGMLAEIIKNTALIMEGVTLTRDLQNEPSQVLTPDSFAKRILSTFKSLEKVKVQILKEKEIQAKKMGGLWAVGKGSQNPPRFCIIEYNYSPTRNKNIPLIVLVGKGVTFDSGGVCVKHADGMDEMKADMSGAAVVAGTILAAARRSLPVSIVGLLPLAENMLSGSAFKPGDIIYTASGKTVEVINTDAEGRLVLADALDYASKLKPDAIIDLATLTGACVVALGEIAAGLFTKNDNLADNLYKTGLKTFDRVWRLPMWDEYSELIKSDIADIKNLGGRWGGAISAAKFLENFVDEAIPWAHIDIAGPAISHKENNFSNDSMTGFGVRLLFEVLLEQPLKKGKV
ncbi:MAG: leucyl aminopeptidase [Bacteroidota bacterium]|nr:leucyl aminopeptidase [Bacteroidota bacterium]